MSQLTADTGNQGRIIRATGVVSLASLVLYVSARVRCEALGSSRTPESVNLQDIWSRQLRHSNEPV